MTTEIQKKLEERGVTEVKYYYERDMFVGNIFTACLLLSKDRKILARGVAVCSMGDLHVKEKGRRISFERAMKAIFKRENDNKINEWDRTYESLNTFYKKSFKIKDEEILTKLTTNLDSDSRFNFDYEEVFLNGFKRLNVYIPYYYPIQKTSEFFKFKSEFEPEPTDVEKKICKLT